MVVLIATIAITYIANRSASFKASDPQSKCSNIDDCRTLAEIVSPTATALFAAIYLSIHQNVPRPDGSHWLRSAIRTALLVLITLVFPEWTCAWAVRSYIIAKRLLPKLEAARRDAVNEWYDKAIDENTPLACKQLYPFRFSASYD